MKIGTMSVLLEFLDIKSRMMFNRLCKHIYNVVMPGLSGRFEINASKKFGDWLEWHNDPSVSGIKVLKDFDIQIGSDKGMYYGEWKGTGS